MVRTEKIKVLHFIGRMSFGGAENWLMRMLRKADRTKVQMDFCVSSRTPGVFDKEIIELGSRIFYCEQKPYWNYFSRLSSLLRKNHYDVVHSHLWLFSGIILKAAHMQGVPIRIAYSHTTRDEYPKAVSRLVYKKIMRSLILKHATHCLGCCSNAAAALFGAEWERNPKCGVLYTSVNVDNYQPNQPQNVFKSDFSIPENSPVIGHVGSFRMAKNHDFFLDIALEIHKQRPDIYFFFAGDGPLRSEMEKKAEKIGIRKQVIFAGNRKDVPQLLMFIFDLLLFPSIYEGMPLTLVEATAAGVPIVCSDVICQEATNVCPEHIVRLPLSVGPEIWAKHTLATLENKVDFSKEAFDKMSKSHFSDQYSLEQLMKIYNQAVH